MEGIALILGLMAKSLINVFSLSGKDTLDYFFTVFSGRTTTGSVAGAADGGVFGQAYKLFLYCAFAIIFLGMLYQIFKAFFGPLVQAESPGRVVIKAVFFSLLVANAQNIVALVFEIAQIPFDAIYNESLQGSFGFTVDDIITVKNGSNLLGTLVNTLSPLNGTIMSVGFWTTLISIILFFMLIKQFMMLALEMAERYLMLGVLTIIAPLCIACGSLKATEDVFKNWLSWIINGCIVLIFTTFFLSVFISNFNASTEIPYMLLWIAWFKVGQRIDEHMNALGLKTAKTGGFGMDVMGALHSGLPFALGLGDKVSGGRMNELATWARSGFNDRYKPQGGFLFSKTDPRLGEQNKSISGAPNAIANRVLKNKTNGKVDLNKMGQKAARNASSLINNMKENIAPNMSTGHGTRTKMPHEKLARYASGEISMSGLSPQAKDDLAKDILDMKAGKNLTQTLKDNNMMVSDIKQDEDGNVNFKASDGNGNIMNGVITENPDRADIGTVTGDDGKERGFFCKTQEDDVNNPMKLSALDESFGEKDVEKDAMAALGATDENTHQNGVIGNEDNTSDENTARIPEDAMTEEGDTAKDFNQVAVDTNDEQIGEDNIDETKSVTTNDGTTYELGEPDENGLIEGTATDGSGDTALFKQDEDGGYVQMTPGADAGKLVETEKIEPENVNEEEGKLQTKDGTTYNLGEQDKNGLIHGVSDDDSENAAIFRKNDDGSYSKMEPGKPLDEGEKISADNVDSSLNSITDNEGTKFSDFKENNDGTITGTSESGATATFKNNGDGTMTKVSEQREFDQSAGISSRNYSEQIGSDNIVNDSNNVPVQATDKKGVSYDLKANGDGTYEGINSTGQKATFTMGEDGSMQMEQTRSYAKGKDGKEFEVSPNSVHDSVRDMEGVSQNIDKSVPAVRHENGTVTAILEGKNKEGKSQTVTLSADSATTRCIDSDSNKEFEMNHDRGFSASIQKGSLQVGAVDTQNNLHTVKDASVKINGHEMDTSKGISESKKDDGKTIYTGYDKNSNKVSFTEQDLRSANITGGQTTVNTTKSADMMNTSGKIINSANFENNTSGPVMVKSADNERIFQAIGTQRYNELGKPSASGEYMLTVGADNIKRFRRVQTDSQNNVPTYGFNADSNKVEFFKRSNDKKGYENYSSEEMSNNMSYGYRNAGQNEVADTYNVKNRHFEIPESERGRKTHRLNQTGNVEDVTMPQHYVEMNGTKYPVDMQQATFSKENRVTPDNNGMIPIYKDGQSVMVHASQLAGYPKNKDKTAPEEWNSGKMARKSVVSDFVKYNDPVNGAEDYFNTSRSSVATQVKQKDQSYFRGIPTNMDLNKGTMQHVLDDDGLITGTYQYQNGIFQAKCYPEGSNVSGLNGSWVEISGQKWFMQPLETNNMRFQLSQLQDPRNSFIGLDMTKNFDVKITPENQPLLTNILNYYGVTDINSLSDIRIRNNTDNDKNGVQISYIKNGRVHVISPFSDSKHKHSAIIATNENGVKEVRGYDYEIPNKQPVPIFNINKNSLENYGGQRGPIRRNYDKKHNKNKK